MKILFISHTYPPILGGVERQNFELAQGLSAIAKVKVIANTKGKKFLPLFLPWAFLRAFFSLSSFDALLLGNGVLSPLAAILKFFHPRKKFFCVIHGLDITFQYKTGWLSKIYAAINIPALKKIDQIFVVSKATLEEAVKAGIERKRLLFIPNGVNPDALISHHTREQLSEIFGKNTKNKKVILRVGRFVPHKGTSWFIENVMTKLNDNIVMIAAGGRVSKRAAGDPDEFIDCERAIVENHLEDRVKLFPCIPQEQLEILLNTVDLVVSPNIHYPGSMEGFGINVIEAGACGRVVLASNLEGLAEAIKNGKNGILVKPEDAQDWINKINKIFESGDEFIEKFGQKIAQFVRENYSWEKICLKYLETMQKIIDQK